MFRIALIWIACVLAAEHYPKTPFVKRHTTRPHVQQHLTKISPAHHVLLKHTNNAEHAGNHTKQYGKRKIRRIIRKKVIKVKKKPQQKVITSRRPPLKAKVFRQQAGFQPPVRTSNLRGASLSQHRQINTTNNTIHTLSNKTTTSSNSTQDYFAGHYNDRRATSMKILKRQAWQLKEGKVQNVTAIIPFASSIEEQGHMLSRLNNMRRELWQSFAVRDVHTGVVVLDSNKAFQLNVGLLVLPGESEFAAPAIKTLLDRHSLTTTEVALSGTLQPLPPAEDNVNMFQPVNASKPLAPPPLAPNPSPYAPNIPMYPQAPGGYVQNVMPWQYQPAMVPAPIQSLLQQSAPPQNGVYYPGQSVPYFPRAPRPRTSYINMVQEQRQQVAQWTSQQPAPTREKALSAMFDPSVPVKM